MKYLFGLVTLCILFLCGCAEDPDYSVIDLGYDYFPNRVGSFIEYEVDSIHYDIEIDTTHFYLKEVIAEDFIDDEGNLATRVERYKKFAMQDEYVLTDVWTQMRTATTAERVEENVRFVRLVFPLNANATWDGNAYNTEDPWDYTYEEVGTSHTLEGFSLNDVVRVDQRLNVNLVDQEEAWEIYARDIGLVQKKFSDLTYQDFEIIGVDYELTMINYGVE